MTPTPSRRRFPIVAIPLLIGLAHVLAACDDPLGPRDTAGEYVLETVAGEALPTLLYATESVAITVVVDSLRLSSNGRGSRVTHQEMEWAADIALDPTARVESSFGYVVRRGRLEVTFDCGPLALCAAGPHLVLVAVPGGLRAVEGYGARFPLEYRRTGPG